MTATFGDLLDLAASPLSDAAADRRISLPSSTVTACAVNIRRVATALSRYVADPLTFPVPAEATTIGVRLYQAAASLRIAADAGAHLPGPGAALPLPGRIAVSARALTAAWTCSPCTSRPTRTEPRGPGHPGHPPWRYHRPETPCSQMSSTWQHRPDHHAWPWPGYLPRAAPREP